MSAFLDNLDSIVKRWMTLAPYQNVGKVMAGFAALADATAEGVRQGRLAAMPGQVRIPGLPQLADFDSVDALPKIGRDRGRRQGLTEAPWDYAQRLRSWLDDWAGAGTPLRILLEVQAILSPNPPLLRIVTAGGTWYTLDPSTNTFTWQIGSHGFTYNLTTGAAGTAAGTAHTWNWDGSSVPAPPDKNDPSRWWLIVYAPLTPYVAANDKTFSDLGVIDDYWNNVLAHSSSPASDPHAGVGLTQNDDPNAGVIGLATPRMWVDLLRTVIADWSMSGCRCAYIIVTFDPASFNPTSDSSPTSIPDGTWGWHTSYNSGSNARLPTRFPNAEYIHASPGGDFP